MVSQSTYRANVKQKIADVKQKMAIRTEQMELIERFLKSDRDWFLGTNDADLRIERNQAKLESLAGEAVTEREKMASLHEDWWA